MVVKSVILYDSDHIYLEKQNFCGELILIAIFFPGLDL